MSATMARQGGQVQLEQSDMSLALNMAKMSKESYLPASLEQTKYLIKKQRAKVQQEKKQGIEFPGHNKVKAAIQRHTAMLRYNQTSSCLPCQNGTAKNPQTHWRRKGKGAPPPACCRVRTPHPPGTPATPPAPTGNTSGVQPSEIVNLLGWYTYSHTALPCAECFQDDHDTEHYTDFDPDTLTDKG